MRPASVDSKVSSTKITSSTQRGVKFESNQDEEEDQEEDLFKVVCKFVLDSCKV